MVSEAIGTKVYAKQRIKAAFLGLLLLVGCWLILQTINPQLLIFNNGLNPVPINYQIVGPTADTRSADQAAIDRVNTLRGTADQADIDRAMAAEERAKAACLKNNGDILPPNWLSFRSGGCRGGGYKSCGLITGNDLYRCGVK